LPDGLGGPYQTATEYYRAWAAKNLTKQEEGSDFVTRIEEASSFISTHDNGPFRLIHSDFSRHNVIVDDDFNMLAVIDWEKSFVGPSEMAARFPMSLQVYPESILTLPRDNQGRIIGNWRENFEDRERYVEAVAFHENQMSDSPRLSSSMVGCRAQEDILYLILRWEHGTPWMHKYQPGIKEGVNAVVERLREEGFHSKEYRDR
jgi:Phosphotransferase enzyme family